MGTAVLYWGNPEWQGPLCLHDMLEFPPEKEEIIKPYVANYPMNLIDLLNVPKEVRERMTSDFRLLLDYMACKNNLKEMKAFMSDNERVIRHPVEFLDAMSEVVSDGRYKIIREQIRGKAEHGELLKIITLTKKKYQKNKINI